MLDPQAKRVLEKAIEDAHVRMNSNPNDKRYIDGQLAKVAQWEAELEGKMIFAVQCGQSTCNETVKLKVRKQDWTEWTGDNSTRRNIQDIFPYLNPDEREMLLSQICPTCWNRIFGDNPDD